MTDIQLSATDASGSILASFDKFRPPGDPPRSERQKMTMFIEAWNAGRVPASTTTKARHPTLARSTLRRWMKAGAPQKTGRKSSIDTVTEVHMAATFLKRPYHTTARHLVDSCEVRFGADNAPGVDTVRRWMRDFRKRYRSLIEAVANPDGHLSNCLPAYGDMAADVHEMCARVEADSTTLDVMCSDGKRYTIIRIQDVHTRMGVSKVVLKSNSNGIAAALRAFIDKFGIPGQFVTDEGQDYTSVHVATFCKSLRIVHKILPPFRGDLKPHVERWFGTMAREYLATLPGFTGHNVAEGEKLKARRTFAERRDVDEAELFGVALSAEDLQRGLDAWDSDVYARRPHSDLDGMSPFEKMQASTAPRRTAVPEELRIALLPVVNNGGRRTVGKKGVSVDKVNYVAGELGDMVGERVRVHIDDEVPGRVFIFATEAIGRLAGPDIEAGDFICIAHDASELGERRRAVAIAAKKRYGATFRAERKAADAMVKDANLANIAQEIAAAKAATAKKVVAMPRRDEPVSMPAVSAAAKAEKDAPEPQDVAVAVGAKHHVSPNGFDASLWWTEADQLEAEKAAAERELNKKLWGGVCPPDRPGAGRLDQALRRRFGRDEW